MQVPNELRMHVAVALEEPRPLSGRRMTGDWSGTARSVLWGGVGTLVSGQWLTQRLFHTAIMAMDEMVVRITFIKMRPSHKTRHALFSSLIFAFRLLRVAGEDDEWLKALVCQTLSGSLRLRCAILSSTQSQKSQPCLQLAAAAATAPVRMAGMVECQDAHSNETLALGRRSVLKMCCCPKLDAVNVDYGSITKVGRQRTLTPPSRVQYISRNFVAKRDTPTITVGATTPIYPSRLLSSTFLGSHVQPGHVHSMLET